MDDRGGVLTLDGGLVDGRMVLSGDRPSRGGGSHANRITWTKDIRG